MRYLILILLFLSFKAQSQTVYGGYCIVNNATALSSIPTHLLNEGTTAYVRSDSSFRTYKSGNWFKSVGMADSVWKSNDTFYYRRLGVRTFIGVDNTGSAGAINWGDIIGTLSAQTDLQAALDAKVDENAAITGATKPKITYDAKGLVTAGADLAAGDMPTGINAANLADGSVSNTEYQYIGGLTSDAQTQIDGKAASSHTHAQSDITNLTTDLAGKQASDADLTAIAALTPTNDDIIQRKAGAWTNRTMAQLKTDLALVKGDVGLGNVENTALSTWTGSVNITTVGTISSGNWNGGVIPGQYGGTGVANTGKTITVSGNTTIGSSTNTVTLATTGNTNVTLPTSGTLATTTGAGLPVEIGIAVSDETTAITTGTAKVTFRMPHAMTVTAVRANVNTVSSSGTPTVDINEGGSSILGTKLTIDASEKTSTTAASAATITDASLADDAEITIDIDVAGTGAKGLKVWIIGTR